MTCRTRIPFRPGVYQQSVADDQHAIGVALAEDREEQRAHLELFDSLRRSHEQRIAWVHQRLKRGDSIAEIEADLDFEDNR